MPLDHEPDSWAQRIDIGPGAAILHSPNLWESRVDVLADSVSPDLISHLIRNATEDLLEEAAKRGVAIDWATVKTRLNEGDSDRMVFVVEASPL